MLTYKITIAKQLKFLRPLLIRYLIFLSIYYYLFAFKFDYPLLLWLFLFFILTDILPTLFVHIQYYYWNKNSIFEIDSNKKIFYYTDKNNKLSFSKDEVLSVENVIHLVMKWDGTHSETIILQS